MVGRQLRSVLLTVSSRAEDGRAESGGEKRVGLFRDYRSVDLLCGLALAKPDGAPLCIWFGDVCLLEGSIGLNDPCYAAGPSSLVACANTSAGISVEVLEE